VKINRCIPKPLKFLFLLVTVLVTIQGVLVFSGISFTSEKAKNVLVDQIGTLTQREASIDGDVRITVSLLPELIVERIHMRSHKGFDDQDFITLSKASAQISLLSLLTGKTHVTDIIANSAQIYLILKKDGRNNWSFDHLLTASGQTSEAEPQAA